MNRAIDCGRLTNKTGTALARYDYDLWGRRTTRTAAAANAEPKSGVLFHESANGTAGAYHQHFFVGATQPLPLTSGDKLTTWVYLDPANPPTEVMLQFADNSWEHRAYWGANQLPWGADNTAARRYMGPLPATGRWVKLEVPISSVGLTGPNITGMAFTLVGGKANWDRTGKTNYLGTETVWFEDKLPSGAVTAAEGGDNWSWTEGQAAPQGFTGHFYHVRSGLHLALYRAYSAELGRWLSRDPIGEIYRNPLAAAEITQGPNVYQYVGGDPVKRYDLQGLDWWDKTVQANACRKIPKLMKTCWDAIDATEKKDFKNAFDAFNSASKMSAEHTEMVIDGVGADQCGEMRDKLMTQGKSLGELATFYTACVNAAAAVAIYDKYKDQLDGLAALGKDCSECGQLVNAVRSCYTTGGAK